MKIEHVKFQFRGKGFEGDVLVPESIQEAITIDGMNEEQFFSDFIYGYIERHKKVIRSPKPRKTRLVKKLSELDDETKAFLKKKGLL